MPALTQDTWRLTTCPVPAALVVKEPQPGAEHQPQHRDRAGVRFVLLSRYTVS